MSDLLPCPFCGGTEFDCGAIYMWCVGCEAETRKMHWNRRAPSALESAARAYCEAIQGGRDGAAEHHRMVQEWRRSHE